MNRSRTAADPYARYGWLLWGAWLIFLAFPVQESLDASTTGRVAVGLTGTGVFAVIYVLGFLGMFGSGPLAGHSGAWVLAALVVVVVVSSPAIGLGVMSFMPFLQALGVFILPRPLNWWWTAAVVAVTLVVPTVLDPSSGWFFIMFIVVAVSLGTGAGRVMADQGESHARVRDELTVTAERDRVARDVHDVLGHSLTVISVKAELAERLVDLDPARARAELVEIQTLARQALAEIRATVGGLRAAGLDDEIAAAAVALRSAGIEADLPADAAALDPRRRTVAAWVLREAVTNVVRHSGARHCVVTLEDARLVVRDDGRAAHQEALVPGNGLRGLRERVAGSGGSLDVHPVPGGGTELEVSW